MKSHTSKIRFNLIPKDSGGKILGNWKEKEL